MALIAYSLAEGIGALKIFDGFGAPAPPRATAAETHEVERYLGGGAGLPVEAKRVVIGPMCRGEISALN